MNGFEALLILLGLVALYFLPTIVSGMRHKANTVPLGIKNLLFGWTVVGWFVLLMQSLSTEVVDVQARLEKRQNLLLREE